MANSVLMFVLISLPRVPVLCKSTLVIASAQAAAII